MCAPASSGRHPCRRRVSDDSARPSDTEGKTLSETTIDHLPKGDTKHTFADLGVTHEITEALEFSRSNVSMGLKELQSWRLVQLRHQPGDRREYFEAPADVWEIFRVLAEERRRREIEPTLSMLRMALLETPATDAERHAQARMKDMHELIDRLMTWFDDVQKLAPETAMQLMGMGATVTKVLEFKDRMTGKSPARATSSTSATSHLKEN